MIAWLILLVLLAAFIAVPIYFGWLVGLGAAVISTVLAFGYMYYAENHTNAAGDEMMGVALTAFLALAGVWLGTLIGCVVHWLT